MTDPWIAVAVGLAVVLVFVLGLAVPRRTRTVRAPVTDAKLDGFNTRLSEIERKQGKTEHDVANIRFALQSVPTKDSVHALELQVTKMDGKVDAMSDKLSQNSHTLQSVADFLMKSTAEAIAAKITEEQK